MVTSYRMTLSIRASNAASVVLVSSLKIVPIPVDRTSGVSSRVCWSWGGLSVPSGLRDGDAVERVLSELVVARVGRVVASDDPVRPWVVHDGAGVAIEPVSDFLQDLLACGNSPASCRSYGYDLLRWFRFLAAIDVRWDRASRGEVRDFVLWLRSCHNPARDRRREGGPAPGSVNARTGKQYLREGYAPATINHAVSVVSAFYDSICRQGKGQWP